MKEHCPKWVSWLFLIVGVLYLLQELGVIAFWTFDWWTVVFIVWGLSGVMSD